MMIDTNESAGQWGVGRLIALLCTVAVATLFSLGQAITFAWLSAFPEQASRLESLEWRFWSYAALALVLLVVDIRIVWIILRRVLYRRKHRSQERLSSMGSKGL
jgi:hypothetical protein